MKVTSNGEVTTSAKITISGQTTFVKRITVGVPIGSINEAAAGSLDGTGRQPGQVPVVDPDTLLFTAGDLVGGVGIKKSFDSASRDITFRLDSAELTVLIDTDYINVRQKYIDSDAIGDIAEATITASYISNLSGVDADTLGGRDSSYFTEYSNLINAPAIPQLGTDYVDSEQVNIIVDSNYIAARIGGEFIDSDYFNDNIPKFGTDYVDSSEVTILIGSQVDSAYVQARQVLFDSALATQLIDSGYIASRIGGPFVDSGYVESQLPTLGTDFVDSTQVENIVNNNLVGTTVQGYDANLKGFVDAFTLPTADGVNGQVLSTNGSGTLSLTTINSGTDTDGVRAIVDSAYIALRVGGNVIDSAYFDANVPTLGTDFVDSTQVISIVDSAYVRLRIGSTIDSNYFDGNIPKLGHDYIDSEQAEDIIANKIGATIMAQDSNLQSFVDVFTLPTTDGSTSQAIITNGAGVLSFATIGSVSDSASVLSLIDSAYVRLKIGSTIDSAYFDANVPTLGTDFVDSGQVESIIDSAYIALRMGGPYIDSAYFTSNTSDFQTATDVGNKILQDVDSNYIADRLGGPFIDSGYFDDNIPKLGTDYVDSDQVRAIVDSDYLRLRIGSTVDSSGVESIIDSAYVRLHVPTNQDLRTTDSVTFQEVRITGNLIVDGDQTIINSNFLTVDDVKITVAHDAPDSASADGAGIEVSDSAGAAMTWLYANNSWNFNRNIVVDSSVFADNVYIDNVKLDSDWVLARSSAGLDSALVIQLIDSGHIGARIGAAVDSAYVDDAIRAEVDSAYIAARFVPAVDSAFVESHFDSNIGNIGNHIIPLYDSVYDLGSSSKKFRDLYLSGNTLYLGDITLRANGDGLRVARTSDDADLNIEAANVPTLGTDFVDSEQVQLIIDSDYIQLRQSNTGSGGTDSATVSAIIEADVDSAYIASRIGGPFVDSAYVTSQVPTFGTDFVDSSTVSTIITTDVDSAYVRLRIGATIDSAYFDANVPTFGTDFVDSSTVSTIITTDVDSAYIQLRMGGPYIDSDYFDANVPTFGTDFVDSAFVTSQGYITAETDTLANVTGRGASTNDAVTFNATGNSVIIGDTLRIDSAGSGFRMTNVGAFDRDGDNFRVFGNAALQLGAGGENNIAITIDSANRDVTIENDLIYRGQAVTIYDSTSVETLVDSSYIASRIGGVFVDSAYVEQNSLDSERTDAHIGSKLGSANEIVIVDSANGTTITSTDTLTIDPSNNYIGINQTSPEVTLHMSGDGEQTAQIRMEQANDTADAPDIRTRRYRGTLAAPANLNTGDYVFRLNIEGQQGGALQTYGSMEFDVDAQDADAVDFDLKLRDSAGNTNSRLRIHNGGTVTFNGAYSFPTADGSSNQVLRTDGTGGLTFVDLPTFGTDFVDSSTVSTIITTDVDSAYVRLRIGSTIDSDYFDTNVPKFGTDYVDSSTVSTIITTDVDSAYVRLRVPTNQDLRTTDNVEFSDLTVSNLTVTGTTTEVNTIVYTINDPLLHLADSNEESDVVDIGFIGHYYRDAQRRHTGIFRDATNEQFYIFNNMVDSSFDSSVPPNVINRSATDFDLATLNVGTISGIYAGFDSDFNAKSTTNLSEGTNLYYTSTRVDSDIDARVTQTFVNNLNVDADTLDNQQGTYYLNYNNFTNTPTIPSFGTDFVDSGTVSTIITTDVDSAYVQLRAGGPYIDSDYFDTNVPKFGTDYVDSSAVSTIITADVDKAFVDALNVDADTLNNQQGTYYLNYNNFTNTPTIPAFGTDYVDSDTVFSLIDSAYVQARASAPTFDVEFLDRSGSVGATETSSLEVHTLQGVLSIDHEITVLKQDSSETTVLLATDTFKGADKLLIKNTAGTTLKTIPIPGTGA
jgi:hypothetical protein